MLHIIERTKSKMAYINIAFDAGARAEQGKYPIGIAHMLEHMIFKGTPNRDAVGLQKEIGFLGGDINAMTSNEIVMYYLSVPAHNLEKSLEILSDMIFNSSFPEEEFLKERNVVLEEESQYISDNDSFMYNKLSERIFTGRLSQPVIGYKDTISNFTLNDLKKFYKDKYKKSGAIISLSSPFSKREAKRLLTKYFGRQSGFKLTAPEQEELSYPRGVEKISRETLEHTHVYVCFPGESIYHKDDAAKSVMMNILGGGMDSRLFENIRIAHGLCYSVGAQSLSFRDQGVSIIHSSTRKENAEKLIDLINIEIEKIMQDKVSEEELQRTKNKHLAQTYKVLESGIASSRINLQRRFFNLKSIDEINEEIAAVTTEDILSVAQKTFDKEKEFKFIVEPKEE